MQPSIAIFLDLILLNISIGINKLDKVMSNLLG